MALARWPSLAFLGALCAANAFKPALAASQAPRYPYTPRPGKAFYYAGLPAYSPLLSPPWRRLRCSSFIHIFGHSFNQAIDIGRKVVNPIIGKPSADHF
jgi:hypothetical protein